MSASSHTKINSKQPQWGIAMPSVNLDLYWQIWENSNKHVHGAMIQKLRALVMDKVTHMYNRPPKLVPQYQKVKEIPCPSQGIPQLQRTQEIGYYLHRDIGVC
jgi:hypothetical protein